MTTGEEARSACCKCIPGAPGFDESDELKNPTQGWGDVIMHDLSTFMDAMTTAYPVVLNRTVTKENKPAQPESDAPAPAQEETPIDSIPVVNAVPIEEAQPVDEVQGSETPSSGRRLLTVGLRKSKVVTVRKAAVPPLHVTSMAAIQVDACMNRVYM